MTGAGASVEHAIALALGAPIRILERTPLGGGSINDTVRLDTSAGVAFRQRSTYARSARRASASPSPCSVFTARSSGTGS